MFMERVREKFNINEPIFTEEIINIFSDYSRMQVFRYIEKARTQNELVQYAKGVYYIPKKTRIGISTITADAVARKKYVSWNNDIYGVIGGIGLLNNFAVTTQVPATIEIVTNKEATRGREIFINDRKFLIKKSRIPLNSKNAAAYTVLQLFDEFGTETELDDYSRKKVLDYIARNRITKEQLLNIVINFPARTMRKLIGSGLLNEIA